MPSKRVANVIPLARLRNDLDYFSYATPENLSGSLAVGDLVKIPFRSSTIDGIVYSFSDSSAPRGYALKEIESITLPSFLKYWQMDLLREMSERYLVSMATIVKMIIPEIPKRQKNIDLANELPSIVASTMTASKPILHKYRKSETLKSILKDLRGQLLPEQQMVVIVPELSELSLVKKIFEGEDCLEYLQKANKLDSWKNWLAVSGGEAKIIIGTRSAIFAPFANLGMVVIVDEEDESHKQTEPNPRYRVIEIAQFLRQQSGSGLALTSLSPSIESLKNVADKVYEFFEYDKKIEAAKVELVDMSKEGLNMNFSIISTQLQSKIESLNGGKALLYLDRKGYFSGLVCRDCGNEIRNGQDAVTDLRQITSCPKCRSLSLRQTGKGINQIAQELKTLYPALRVKTFDRDEATTITGESLLADSDIILSTNFGLRHLDLTKFSCIASLSADLMMSWADFRSAEDVFTSHSRLAARLDSSQELLIQTRNIDHYIFTALANRNLKYFYLEEMKERKMFNLPPFGQLLEVIYRNIDQQSGEKELQLITKKLKEAVPEGSMPYSARPAFDFKTTSGFHWQITLKYPQGYDFAKELSFLRGYPVTIDTSP